MTNDPTKMVAQFLFKPREMILCAGIIAGAALRSPSEFWLDECDFSKLSMDSRNAIGNTTKAMIGLKLIRKTGAWRASKAEGRKGSTAFAYHCVALATMKSLLRKIEPELAKELNPQSELAF